jgi:hypothetical protein
MTIKNSTNLFPSRALNEKLSTLSKKSRKLLFSTLLSPSCNKVTISCSKPSYILLYFYLILPIPATARFAYSLESLFRVLFQKCLYVRPPLLLSCDRDVPTMD